MVRSCDGKMTCPCYSISEVVRRPVNDFYAIYSYFVEQHLIFSQKLNSIPINLIYLRKLKIGKCQTSMKLFIHAIDSIKGYTYTRYMYIVIVWKRLRSPGT